MKLTGWIAMSGKAGQFLQYFVLIGLVLASGKVLAGDVFDQCRQFFDAADYANAKQFCQLAANQGYAEAQTLLGEMYDRGHGLPADPDMTAKWWKRAAQQSYLPAQNQLALKYYYGGDVFGRQPGWVQDFALAREIWQQSALQGAPTSQFMMGEFYLRGEGVERDYAEAYAWFTLALQGGYKLATDSLIEISRVISSDQKKQGLKRLDGLKKQIELGIKERLH